MATTTLERWIDELQSRGQYTFVRADAVTGSGLSPEAVKKATPTLSAARADREAQGLLLRPRAAGVRQRRRTAALVVRSRPDGRDEVSVLRWPAQCRGTARGVPPPAPGVPGRHGPVRPAARGWPRRESGFSPASSSSRRPSWTSRRRLDTYVFRPPNPPRSTWYGSRRPPGTWIMWARFWRICRPALDPRKLLDAVRVIQDLPNAQRLGYILDRVHGPSLTKTLHGWVERQAPRDVPLRSGRRAADAPADRRWHVLVNQPLEVEA